MNKHQQRKQDHLDILRLENVSFREKSSGFDRLQWSSATVNAISWNDIDTKTRFLGKELAFPFMISSMSGGVADSTQLNRDLAMTANRQRIALGMGSIRPMFHSDLHAESYEVMRNLAPDVPLLANIGIGQIASGEWRTSLKNLLNRLQVNGLIVHFNKVQELMQPDGDLNYSALESEIQSLFDVIDLPIIAKEVGHGFSFKDMQMLTDWGFRFIDVAGAGGTSWSRVEQARSADQADPALLEWGISTVESLKVLKRFPSVYAMASGGIRSGDHIAKAIALGARLTGSATPIYQKWAEYGTDGVEQLLNEWQQTLKSIMFLVGAKSISELHNNPALFVKQ